MRDFCFLIAQFKFEFPSQKIFELFLDAYTFFLITFYPNQEIICVSDVADLLISAIGIWQFSSGNLGAVDVFQNCLPFLFRLCGS